MLFCQSQKNGTILMFLPLNMYQTKPINLLNSVGLPLLLILVMWTVFVIEYYLGTSYYKLGIYPQRLSGLQGIIFSPFLHGDYKHLVNNTPSIFVLTWALRYFYRKISNAIFLLSWLVGGLFVWIAARESYHIGMSGVIYSLAFFIFFSGVFRKEPRVMAISLFVVFMYGSMVWGILPIDLSVSYESHLIGALLGTGLAYFYRNDGATFAKKKYNFELEEEQDEEMRKKGYRRVEDAQGFLLRYEPVDKNDE
jgi:membrane associated rhomboid family serine protease